MDARFHADFLARDGPRQRAEEPASTAAAKPKLDLDYITPDAVAGVALYPRAVLTSAAFQDMPIEVLSAAGKKMFGIDPAQIEQAIAIAEPPTAGPPGGVVILRMTAPIGSDRVLAHALGPDDGRHTRRQDLSQGKRAF